ncbi:MAG TPA: hypothetical protein VKE88_01195, partial [Candidatus Nanoarchaeia archaeon]|nr:hypothetical protein [Candidatus Nanoarchaeia archaeon]
PRWDDAFKYDPVKPVNSLKNVSQASTTWPDSHVNITFANETMHFAIDTTIDQQLTQTAACCPQSFCFNGTSCINSEVYRNNPKLPPIFMTYGETGYRCSQAGNWSVVSLKQDFYRNDTGYCTEDSECYADNRCFADGEWDLFDSVDRMCSNGAWTTRTKYLAASLLQFVDDNSLTDYSLYCDKLGDATDFAFDDPDSNYVVKDNKNFDDYVFQGSQYCYSGNCINNVCVLSYDDTVIMATSLNTAMNDTLYPFYEAFGFNTSTDKEVTDYDTGDSIELVFDSNRAGSLHYSSKKQVAYYTTDRSIIFDPSPLESFVSYLTSPVTSLINTIKSLFTPPATPEFTNTLDKVGDFDRVYFAQKGSKTIQGIQEKRYNDVTQVLESSLSITYSDFDSNITYAVLSRGEVGLDAQEDTATNTHTILGISSDPQLFNTVWPDLTAKVRIE